MTLRLDPRGDANGIFWIALGAVQRVEHASVGGKPGTAQHQARMKAAVNEALATVIKLDSLPADDPDRSVDPKRGDIYWGKADGTADATVTAASGYLVSRAVTMRIIGWDGTAYVCETWNAE